MFPWTVGLLITLGTSDSEDLSLTMHVINFEVAYITQLTSALLTDRRRDTTDRCTTCHGNTSLYVASRGITCRCRKKLFNESVRGRNGSQSATNVVVVVVIIIIIRFSIP